MMEAGFIRVLRLIFLILSVVFVCPFAFGKVIYVDDDAIGTNDGSSWQNAYNFLQDALADANIAEKPIEIRVAQGTYKPDQGGSEKPGDRKARFQLINDVAIKGGYAGFGAANPNVRNIDEYLTILSGDLNGDDIVVSEPCDLFSEPTRIENSSHVVESNNTNETAVMDGCIITGGYFRGGGRHFVAGAAGMVNYSGSPILINCTFIDNAAVMAGSALCNRDEGNLTLIGCTFDSNYNLIGGTIYNAGSISLTNCVFTGNRAEHGGGVYNSGSVDMTNCQFIRNSASRGGGIYNYGNNPELIITNCTFINNSASRGGGMYSNSGNPKLSGCRFIGNNARETGGGLDSRDDSNSMLIDCVLIGNSSNGFGGGVAGSNTIYNCVISSNFAVKDGGAIHGGGEFINCTIIGNKAGGDGGGIYTQEVTTIVNSILYDNKALIGNQIYLGSNIIPAGRSGTAIITPSALTIGYSNVQGGEEQVFLDTDCTLIWKPNNLEVDPLFAYPGYWADADDPNVVADPNDPNAVWIDGDYHLKSQAGRWDPNSQSWLIDDVTSPCIDAGDPNNPIGHEPFPNGGIINMGAYGGTAEASKSPSGLHAKYGGGTGEPNDPYLIYTTEHMNTVGLHEEDWDKHFKLMADIDLSAFDRVDFNIIGYWRSWDDNEPFTGTFDGNGYRVLNFTYRSTEKDSIGLFGFIRTGLGSHLAVQNLGLVDPNVDAVNARGVGALVGQLFNGIISGCYVEGGRVSGDSNVGGLLGWISATNMGPLERNIVNCYTSCQVSGNGSVGGIAGNVSPQTRVLYCQSFGTIIGKGGVGGLIGSSGHTEISHCYTFARVIGKDNTGGLVGLCDGGNDAVTACAAFGSVDGESDTGGLVGRNIYAGIVDSYSVARVLGVSRVGGLVGVNQGTVSTCYAAGLVKGESQTGGLIGSLDADPFYPVGSVSDSFWDTDTSGQTTSAAGTGVPTAEMQAAGTFLEAGWDFVGETANGTEDIWWILEGRDYPQLWSELIEKQLTDFRLPKSKTENRQSQMSYCFTIAVNLTRAFFVGRCGSIVPMRPTFWPTKPFKSIFEAVPAGKA